MLWTFRSMTGIGGTWGSWLSQKRSWKISVKMSHRSKRGAEKAKHDIAIWSNEMAMTQLRKKKTKKLNLPNLPHILESF